MQTAYQLLGRPFLESLTELERSPEELIVKETPTFVSLSYKQSKEILFVTKEAPSGLECICEVAWNRKTGSSTQLLCKHEISYLLWKYCFPQYSHYSTRLLSREQDLNEMAIAELLYKASPQTGHN